jgi:hypothetical protein
MSCNSICPPLLILAFNRPDTTRRVLEAVRAARPSRLYFAVDGPRANQSEDAAAVQEVRELTREIDWDCDTRTLFPEHNLGCKLAVSQAITWFFSEVEAGIILEDDCVAEPSFFAFAGELLERYRDDHRIAMVSGDNFQQGRRRTAYSYYFSRYAHIWGWATWADRWRSVSIDDLDLPGIRRAILNDDWLGSGPFIRMYWLDIVEYQAADKFDSWGYSVAFHCSMPAGTRRRSPTSLFSTPTTPGTRARSRSSLAT